jgi:alkylhydroperoxidase family enzyme
VGTLRAVAGSFEELRALDSAAPEPPAALVPYLEKVRTGAYAVTDADVEGLKQAGLSEDEIFDATVTVAIAQGLRRLDAAMAAIG